MKFTPSLTNVTLSVGQHRQTIWETGREYTAAYIAALLNQAYNRGRSDVRDEVAVTIGLKPPSARQSKMKRRGTIK